MEGENGGQDREKVVVEWYLKKALRMYCHRI